MPHASRFVDLEETRLHYLEWASEGPAVVILHGNTHCGGVYETLGERLSADFRVLAVDLRGHGLSDKPQAYSWRQMRDDITQLIDALDLREVLLVAHSRGGGVSLLTATARPKLVRGVVAYEPTVPLSLPARPTPEQSARWTRALSRRSTFESREEAYRHFRHRGAFAGWQDDYFRAFVEHALVERNGGGLELASPTWVETKLYEAMGDVGPWQEVRGCQTPALLVYGERGGRLGEGRDPTVAIRPMFPRCEVVVMSECTHSGPMERPEAFEALIREFAGRV